MLHFCDIGFIAHVFGLMKLLFQIWFVNLKSCCSIFNVTFKSNIILSINCKFERINYNLSNHNWVHAFRTHDKNHFLQNHELDIEI